jgi:multiple antibiotic resistance protein
MFWETIALTVAALLPIINPFSVAPMFVSLTVGSTLRARNREASLACVYAFAILATFLLVGGAIIAFLGTSVPGLRVAGGLIISVTGFKMLFPASPADQDNSRTPQRQKLEIAFTPLAMPGLAGPGSISVVLTTAAQIRSTQAVESILIYIAVMIGMAATLIISYLVLRAAGSMEQFMGKSGIDAMTRIFGFLLIAIGMQFVLTGISDFYGIAQP